MTTSLTATTPTVLPYEMLGVIAQHIIKDRDVIAFAKIDHIVYNNLRPILMAREHTLLEKKLSSLQEKSKVTSQSAAEIRGTIMQPRKCITASKTKLEKRQKTKLTRYNNIIAQLKTEITEIQKRLKELSEGL